MRKYVEPGSPRRTTGIETDVTAVLDVCTGAYSAGAPACIVRPCVETFPDTPTGTDPAVFKKNHPVAHPRATRTDAAAYIRT